MLKRIVPILCILVLLSGCNKPVTVSTSSSDNSNSVDLSISKETMQKYIDIGNDAVSKIEATDATTRSIVKSQAIYKEILKQEGNSILSKINISDEEIKSYVANPNNPGIIRTVILKDSKESVWNYYVTKEDPLLSKNIKVGDNFMGSIVTDIHDTTQEEKNAKAKENISSGILSDTVTKYTDECMNLRSGK